MIGRDIISTPSFVEGDLLFQKLKLCPRGDVGDSILLVKLEQRYILKTIFSVL